MWNKLPHLSLSINQKLLIALVLIALLSLFVPMFWDHDSLPIYAWRNPANLTPPTPTLTVVPSLPPLNASILNTPLAESYSAWSLKMASFNTMAPAISLKAQLLAQQVPAYLSLAGDNPSIIRVFVGPYTDLEQVKTLKQKLDTGLHLSSIVINYNPVDIREIGSWNTKQQ